jgi:16S rRNA (adenine1518-N6/adenine1519-N6)-dimethyltransferase
MQEPRHHRAKKSLGQNFLVDRNICEKIVSRLDIHPGDTVLEIGPGQGALTSLLLESEASRVIALEKDDDLAHYLKQRWPELELNIMDALQFDWKSLAESAPCKIIGNLPYNIASKLIWDIVSKAHGYTKAVFMVQHEVALRLTAVPSNKQYGGLTVWVKNHARTRYAFKVPASVFRPQPKVDSAIVEFFPCETAMLPKRPQQLDTLIKICFQKRRKQLYNILKLKWNTEIEKWFELHAISPKFRPENLTPEQFESLSRLM